MFRVDIAMVPNMSHHIVCFCNVFRVHRSLGLCDDLNAFVTQHDSTCSSNLSKKKAATTIAWSCKSASCPHKLCMMRKIPHHVPGLNGMKLRTVHGCVKSMIEQVE